MVFARVQVGTCCINSKVECRTWYVQVYKTLPFWTWMLLANSTYIYMYIYISIIRRIMSLWRHEIKDDVILIEIDLCKSLWVLMLHSICCISNRFKMINYRWLSQCSKEWKKTFNSSTNRNLLRHKF